MKVPIMAEMMMDGESPEILFWVGCAGSFDQRAQKITKAFATILNKVGIKYAILGKEEACTGDPARREYFDRSSSACVSRLAALVS